MSVWEQTWPAAQVSVAADLDHEGAWATRGRALAAVRTGWTAFLDDDDQFKPEHIERLLACAQETGADYVFSWFDTRYTIRQADPLGHFGKPFDPANPHHTTMTVLVRTELAQVVGFTPPADSDLVGGEDWRFTLGCVAAGARIIHLPERTWYWHHDRIGTQGLRNRWTYPADARRKSHVSQ